MKIPKTIKIKNTTRLFFNQYKFKLVLISATAHFFRGNNLKYAKEMTDNLRKKDYTLGGWGKKNIGVKDLDYSDQIIKTMSKMENYCLRVESPLLSFYTNSEKDAETILKLKPEFVKYISIPESPDTETKLESNKVITKKIDFDFKVTIGRTRDSFDSFLEWCKDNPKIRMPKRAKRDLEKTHSWGGSYFYVKDAKTLTLVKLFIGSYINKVESVVKI